MTERQIIESTIALKQTYLSKKNKNRFMICWLRTEENSLSEMKYKYPSIEVDLQVIDKSPFLIRPFHVKEEN